jgi:tetratricopeptide (TPR) repeat protein
MRWPIVFILFAFVWEGGTATLPPAPVAQSLVAVARDALEGVRPDDDEASLVELGRIAQKVREAVRQDPGGHPVDALNQTVFGTFGFVREVDDTDLRFVLLPSVLKTRRGTCVGLGTLYLALAEALGWPAEGIMVPGHFFVRVDEKGRRRNVELLRRGEEMPDAWYRARFPIPGGADAAYGRPLLLAEVLGIVEYDIGNERRRQGRIPEARRAFERAARHFPDFAEAHASLGATLHVLGALDEAEAEYEAARRANAHLPGVDRNVDLLEEERSRAR